MNEKGEHNFILGQFSNTYFEFSLHGIPIASTR